MTEGAESPGGDDPGGTLPVSALVADTEAALREVGLDNAGAEARWMVEDAVGLGAGDLVVEGAMPVTVGAVRRVEAMVVRRLAGEPLQYVLGHWPFRTLDLMVDPRVLIPRPETEAVVGVALDELRRLASGRRDRPSPAPVVVDLGTGSGAIALSIAVEAPGTVVVATDRSPDALAVTAANLAGLGMAGASVQLCAGDWFDALVAHRPDLAGGVDMIVSNPPYVATGDLLPVEVSGHEPSGALYAGPRGTEDLEAILAGAAPWLAPGGVVVLECGPHQASGLVVTAASLGFADTEVHVDLTGRDRTVVARTAPASATPSTVDR